MNPNKIFFLNELPRSKVKNDKKGEEALRSNPLSVDKKWAPWPVAVVGGKLDMKIIRVYENKYRY